MTGWFHPGQFTGSAATSGIPAAGTLQRLDAMYHDPLPERLAGRNEPCVMLALRLVEGVVFERFEMEAGAEVERMIGNRTSFGLRRWPHVSVLQVGDSREEAEFRNEQIPFLRSQILA